MSWLMTFNTNNTKKDVVYITILSPLIVLLGIVLLLLFFLILIIILTLLFISLLVMLITLPFWIGYVTWKTSIFLNDISIELNEENTMRDEMYAELNSELYADDIEQDI